MSVVSKKRSGSGGLIACTFVARSHSFANPRPLVLILIVRSFDPLIPAQVRSHQQTPTVRYAPAMAV